MTVFIGSDHAGYDLKESIKSFLSEQDRVIDDAGTFSRDAVDYPDIARDLATKLLSVEPSPGRRGILICGSGVGVSVAANKVPGIRAGLCHDAYSARQGVEHDNMNVLVLGARVVGTELAKVLVQSFLDADFSNETRHVRRLKKLETIEADFCSARVDS